MTGPNGRSAARSVGLSVIELADSRTAASVRPLQSSPLDGRLLFDGEYSSSAVKVGGPSLQSITLRVEACAGGIMLGVDVADLETCASLLWLRIADEDAAVRALAVAPLAAAHRDTANEILFRTTLGEVFAAPAGAYRKCPLCDKELVSVLVALSLALYHAVFTPNTLPHSEMCPLCFGAASKCPPYIVKNGTSLQPRIICSANAPSANESNLESAVNFQAKTLAKSNATRPSTNRPIVCPACHPQLADEKHLSSPLDKTQMKNATKRPAVWSYNIQAHWARLHASSDMPQGLATAIMIAPTERSLNKL